MKVYIDFKDLDAEDMPSNISNKYNLQVRSINGGSEYRNIEVQSLAEHNKQVRKEVCDEIIKFVDSNSKYTQEYGDIIYSMSLIRELDKLIEIDEPNQTQGE